MLTEERRTKIQELMRQKNTVSICELAGLFGTSEMTARRDLDELQQRGVCERIHGGARRVRPPEPRNAIYPSFWQREHCQAREKEAIGRAAAALVAPGDVIVVDTGTTAACLAQALLNAEPITLITNSLRVIDLLQDASQVTLICPGGTLFLEDRHTSGGDLAFVGALAVSTLRGLRAKKAFISTSGFTIADGAFNASQFQAEIKRVLIDIAEEAILIVDHTKFGRVDGFLVASARAFSKVITDTLAPAADVAALRALGIQVIQVEPAENAVAPDRPYLRATSRPGRSNGDCGTQAASEQSTDRPPGG
jgi:DeoR/GlpR family transcriptional regulator of sugar metabolism